MLKTNILPKSPRIELSNERLPNGNVVKLSQVKSVNIQHFTVGDPMAFPIVKMGNKNPRNLPFPLHEVDPHLIQQCIGPPHPPSQTAAQTAEVVLHTYAVKFPLVTMAGAPQICPKSTHSRGPIAKPHHLPHPWTRPTYDAKRHPDAIRHFCTMHWTDRQTDRPTYRSRENLTTIGRCAPRATRPNNNNNNK